VVGGLLEPALEQVLALELALLDQPTAPRGASGTFPAGGGYCDITGGG
jgi:hypothetical protein